MSSARLLVDVGLAQLGLVLLLITWTVTARWHSRRRSRRIEPLRAALDRAMARWTTAGGDVADVEAALTALPPIDAADALVKWSSRAPGGHWPRLAERLTALRWTARIRRYARSRWWWRRLDAARFLSTVATLEDVPALRALLADRHPAVHLAAVSAVARLPEPELVRAALASIPILTATGVAYHAGMLRQARAVLTPLLMDRLHLGEPALARYAEFAARVADPALRAPLTALASHPDFEVRIQVARALGGYPHLDSAVALTGLAADPAWQVRAQALRSFGRLGDAGALPVLRAGLADPEWWVRLHAALAASRLGPAGLDVLLATEQSEPGLARDMARLILSASPQARADFAT